MNGNVSFLRVFLIHYCFLQAGVKADKATHLYQPLETVPLLFNKVGNTENPQVAYEYSFLPYCETDRSSAVPLTLSESLGGFAFRDYGLGIQFASQETQTFQCTTEPLTRESANKFERAARESWFYELYLDDLPIWGTVGGMQSNKRTTSLQRDNNGMEEANHREMLNSNNRGTHVYTNRTLQVFYKRNRIVRVDLTSHGAAPIKTGRVYTFRFNVVWKEAPWNEEFESRFERYLDHAFFYDGTRYMSLLNGCMVVAFLTIMVVSILKSTLKKDTEPGRELQMTAWSDRNTSWKELREHVWIAPSCLPWMAALLGTGWHLAVLLFGVLVWLFISGRTSLNGRGEIVATILIGYAFSSSVAGYTSGYFFKKYHVVLPAADSERTAKTTEYFWQLTMALTLLLCPTVSGLVFWVLNSVSAAHGTIYVVSSSATRQVLWYWIGVGVPMNVAGTLLGRHHQQSIGSGAHVTAAHELPHIVAKPTRPLPKQARWYGRPAFLYPTVGILIFGSIFIEFYFFMSGLWVMKFYHGYGYLLCSFFIATLTTMNCSIVGTFFLLNTKNREWQWTIFKACGSTGVYVFVYVVYYFLLKTKMNGWCQSSFYFGCMGLISLAVGLFCGSIGHLAASQFVRAIYTNLKVT